MPTHTVPAPTGGATYKELSVTVTDWTGDRRTDTYMIEATASLADVETFIDSLKLLTNATIWRAKVCDVFEGVEDNSNADEEVWENATDNLVIQTKNTTKDSIRMYVPAPQDDLFIENTDNIDPSNANLAAGMTAFLALLPATYTVRGVRFTSRRQINQQVKF